MNAYLGGCTEGIDLVQRNDSDPLDKLSLRKQLRSGIRCIDDDVVQASSGTNLQSGSGNFLVFVQCEQLCDETLHFGPVEVRRRI